MTSPTIQLAFGLPGGAELLLIFGIVILMFGGSKLPQLGKAIGEGINNFKKSYKDDEDENVQVAEVSSSDQANEITNQKDEQVSQAESNTSLEDQR